MPFVVTGIWIQFNNGQFFRVLKHLFTVLVHQVGVEVGTVQERGVVDQSEGFLVF
jgi:hypothetical protein